VYKKITVITNIRATPLVLSLGLYKLKLDEEKSIHASLARQNSFRQAFAEFAEAGESTTKANTCLRRV
jgi:hypothetical protein